MNGLLNFFRPLRQQNKPKYNISTDLLVSTLSKFSIKAKALAAWIRSDSASYAVESATPNVVTTLLEWSAENMESVALVIDPIVDDMSQHETMDLTTVSCGMGQLLTHIGNATIPNIVSIAEIVYTKSGNATMERLYKNYMAEKKTNPLVDAGAANVDATNQCGTSTEKTTSSTSIQAQNVDSIVTYFGMLGLSLLGIVGLILFFPLSFIVSIVTFIFAIFALIFSLIFKGFNDTPSNDDECGPGFNCDLEGAIILAVALILIASPILVPIGIVLLIAQFFLQLFSPIFQSDQASETINEVMQHVTMLLKSPMANMVDTLKRISKSDEATEAREELDCAIQTMLCQNDALMASLPF
jgi:hypothetical protein